MQFRKPFTKRCRIDWINHEIVHEFKNHLHCLSRITCLDLNIIFWSCEDSLLIPRTISNSTSLKRSYFRSICGFNYVISSSLPPRLTKEGAGWLGHFRWNCVFEARSKYHHLSSSRHLSPSRAKLSTCSGKGLAKNKWIVFNQKLYS